jgi:beta-ketoacyl-acyl-carrier-protein synthase II
MKRVVVTGIGIIAPLGIGKDRYWENVKKNASGLSYVKEFEPFNFRSKSFGVVKDFDPAALGLSLSEVRRMDRITQMGVICTAEAIKDAQLDWEKLNRDRVGVGIGNAISGTKFMDEEFVVLTNRAETEVLPEDVSPYAYAKSMPNTTCSEVAYKYGLTGVCCTLATGCTAGIDSVGFAYDLIRSGDQDIVVAGSSETPVTPITIAAFESIRSLSTNNDPPGMASRPFDNTRNGFVLGEGAGIVILEELQHAKKRGADIYAEIIGFSSVNNATHMTALPSDGEDVARSIKLAMKEAKITKEDIDYISAHGSGTRQNDTCETGAYKRIFGDYAYHIPISSTKSMVGHALGAATAIELVTCFLALKDGFIPPTINYTEKDETCDLDYVPNEGREKEINLILKDASGFSGIHTAIVLKKFSK